MSSNNRSPLGFGPILLFHICILASGVMLQNLAAARPQLFLFALGVVLVGGAVGAFFARRFLWDVFRNFKSAAVILSLLVLSCVLGTMFIQDLDLRRDGVFFDPARDFPRDADGNGVVPPFDDKRASTRFALAESSFLLWLSPDEQRQRLLEEKVKLSDTEKEFARQAAEAFGERASDTYVGQVLRSKRRNVEQLTTSLYAKRNFSTIHKYFFYVRQFRLFDIFESWWFYMLLGLLAINVTIGTIARAPWNVRDIGVAITHAGILTILTGAL
ncbi:MAG: cytochrome c biogenesis protein ResB, partial [Planctomycetota bacterium]|nr:cytochrome c biogenesis protein ResB [Planctomycetota bacterium]